ncbi:hypothetical protein ATN01_01265 [Buchnera aphidicola (Diuraphis noxia)]|uniref:UPF0125 protein ATN01_01265 n=1 Tax=Buchnera aphidicola subsp. Diuraphis noxia TaxID=118101 RepID=A0A1B2H8D4_BUCDN|nr:RnfH family protein [Buchnera aphidicola]ANZ22470.1 hypothetical protein ATN01_01265 [Buchnera aphidicola (Diuraphis noxia)]
MHIIQATVVYALPDIQYILKVNMKIGSTVKEAILESKLLTLIKGLSLYTLKVGIYNKLVYLNSRIENGDRIEIYRNLIFDPKERRRKNILIQK